MMGGAARLRAADVKAAARQVGFALAGLARPARLDAEPLARWLQAGYAAGMGYMHRRQDERLDPGVVLPGCASVLALGIPFFRPGETRGAVASYARGRDYHHPHRERMKKLRKRLLTLAPGIETYACVDTGVVMEKAWAVRAGLGFFGKNGLVIHPEHGSRITLSIMLLDREVDRYDVPVPDGCGTCERCLRACPTKAFPAPQVVDARACVAYHSIESREAVPEPLRRAFKGRVFGCDTCQDVCPWNRADAPAGDPASAPRPLGTMSAVAMAALSPADYARLSAGTALARPGHDGLRRNAALALGAAHDASARPVLRTLARDPSPVVAEAAAWALAAIAKRHPE